MTSAGACDACLRRTELIRRLAGHLEVHRGRVWELLALEDDELIDAVGGVSRDRLRTELRGDRSAPRRARSAAAGSGLELVCRCDAAYPAQLRDLVAPPAVLHVAGGQSTLGSILSRDPVAVVGARRPGDYGTGVARGLGRGLATAGITVVSGMAPGIDAAAHEGALEAGGATVAVLAGSADKPYPQSNAGLYRQILAGDGVIVSEMPPQTSVRKWMFVARNRLIAGLAGLTVVVQAARGSGSLLTAQAALDAGRLVGAVPGPVTSRLSAGPNELLREGALLLRGAPDIVEELGLGARPHPGAFAVRADSRPPLTVEQQTLLDAISDGADTASALLATGELGERCLAVLASLELAGRLTRSAGGRLVVIP